MISRSFNSPILFIHEIWWLCNLSQYHPISLHTLLSMILSNTRKNLQKNDFHALCVITIYSLYWLLKYRKDTLFVCYWTKNTIKWFNRNFKFIKDLYKNILPSLSIWQMKSFISLNKISSKICYTKFHTYRIVLLYINTTDYNMQLSYSLLIIN